MVGLGGFKVPCESAYVGPNRFVVIFLVASVCAIFVVIVFVARALVELAL